MGKATTGGLGDTRPNYGESMATADPDRARLRFIFAITRFINGARLEKERLRQRTEVAPRLLPGTPYEVADLTDTPGNDLDYYIYELGRLQDAARAICKVFESPPEVVDALATFDGAIPHLREARNPLTHPSDDKRLDNVAWFDALVRLWANGSVESLLDPRDQHGAVEALAEVLLAYLRGGITDPAATPAADPRS